MRIAIRLLLFFFVLGLVACGGTDGADPTPDIISTNDTGTSDAQSEPDEGVVDEGPAPDTNPPQPDTPVSVDEGPPIIENACQDPESIDVAAIQANPMLRLYKLGIGGWDVTQNMFCDSTTAGDVDNDVTTTFPGEDDVTDQSTFSACSPGLNNALIALQDVASGFGLDLRQQMIDNTTNGSINPTIEVVDNGDGSWTLNFYQTVVSGGNEFDEETGTWSVCNITDAASSPCDFEIDIVSFDESCLPLVSMQATVTEGVLSAGGPDSVFSLSLPVEGVGNIELALSSVKVSGTVNMADGQVTGITVGLLTGILPKEGIVGLVNNLLPPDVGIPPELVISLLDGIFDVDTDEDGLNDALSVGLMFEATPISVLGLVDDSTE
jgi:hypothetical protein